MMDCDSKGNNDNGWGRQPWWMKVDKGNNNNGQQRRWTNANEGNYDNGRKADNSNGWQ